MRLMYKEIELVGTASGRGCYPTALQLMSKGRVKIDPLVTHRFNLMDLEKGIEVMEKKIDNPIRVLINSAQ
jgi:threonine dehydrogenase-like Zn-dependent dehydrogenase